MSVPLNVAPDEIPWFPFVRELPAYEIYEERDIAVVPALAAFRERILSEFSQVQADFARVSVGERAPEKVMAKLLQSRYGQVYTIRKKTGRGNPDQDASLAPLAGLMVSGPIENGEPVAAYQFPFMFFEREIRGARGRGLASWLILHAARRAALEFGFTEGRIITHRGLKLQRQYEKIGFYPSPDFIFPELPDLLVMRNPDLPGAVRKYQNRLERLATRKTQPYPAICKN